MNKLLLATAALVFLFAACKKGGGDDPQTTTSRKDTLTTGKWYITAATATTTIFGKDTTLNLYGQFDACAQDDRYLFKTEGKVINDQHILKCDTSGPAQTDGGTWSLSTNADTLRMSGGTLPGNFQIQSFSNTQMQLRADTNYSGFPVKLLATFRKD